MRRLAVAAAVVAVPVLLETQPQLKAALRVGRPLAGAAVRGAARARAKRVAAVGAASKASRVASRVASKALRRAR